MRFSTAVRFVPFIALSLCSGLHAQSPAAQTSITQQYHVDQWRVGEGLPGNRVNALLRTSDGYLWIGTDKGLARFDGYRFTVFNSINTPAIVHQVIATLFEDRNHGLWIGTGGGGLLRYKDGAFLTFGKSTGLSSDYISAICEDDSGALWIGTSGGGLNLLYNGTVSRFTTADGLATDFVTTTFIDKARTLWIAPSSGGLQRFRKGRIETVNTQKYPEDDHVFSLCQDRNDVLWAGSSHGILLYRGGKFVYAPFWKNSGRHFVHGLAIDHGGMLWIATNGQGLGRYDGRRVEMFTTSRGIPSNIIRALVCDVQGNIWVGTAGAGLLRLRQKLVRMLTVEDGLPSNYVRSLFEDKSKTLWIGTDGGIARRRNGRTTVSTTRQGLTSDLIRPISEDMEGTVWIGTWGGGVTLFRNGKFTPAPIVNRYIRALHPDNNGQMWVGTNGGGLIRYSANGQKVFSSSTGLSNNLVSTVVADSAGALWVGTSGGGINTLAGDSLTLFRRSNGLSSDFIPSLYLDKEDVVWAGTNGGGLNSIRRGVIHTWTSGDGLADDVIHGIVEDGERNLWMATTKGIMRVNKDELMAYRRQEAASFRTLLLTEADGLRTTECSGASQNTVCSSHDGMLWFATIDGLAMIDPRVMDKLTIAWPVHIENLLVDSVSISATAGGSVDYRNGDVEIRYTAVNFQNAPAVRFQYKLEGFDEHWEHVGSRRAAYYTNVPPGTYMFHVLAEGNTAAGKPVVASVRFTILPPFWMTTWFRLSMAVGIVALVAGTVRIVSTRTLRRKLRMLEAQSALERERMRISKDMHDELGASLTKIALLSEVAKRTSRTKKETLSNLDRISDAARNVAETMDEIVWAVNPTYDTLEGLIAYTGQYVEEYLSLTTLRCRMDIPQELPRTKISSEVRHHVFLVVKEALTNAIKYSGGTEIRFSVAVAGKECVIVLGDNGRGFSPDKVRPFSDGLSNMKKRMDDAGVEFSLKSKRGAGTTLTMRIPS